MKLIYGTPSKQIIQFDNDSDFHNRTIVINGEATAGPKPIFLVYDLHWEDKKDLSKMELDKIKKKVAPVFNYDFDGIT